MAASWLAASLAFLALEGAMVFSLLAGPGQGGLGGGLGPGGLGPATMITLGRGALVAATAGMAWLGPLVAADPVLAWLPGPLFAAACLLDGVDGLTARRLGCVSRLGAGLDTRFDALAMLAGSLCAVAMGRVGLWYVLMGLAYYAFQAGAALRRRLGLRVAGLDRSRARRFLAGWAMAATALLLFPILGAPARQALALAAALPFLAHFVRDWLVVCGRLPGESRRARTSRLAAK